MNFSSRFLITVGFVFILFGIGLVWQRYSPQKLSFNNLEASVLSESESFPKAIIIPSLKINLPIYPARIKENVWEASSIGASYLISSPTPGKRGNSIIYGHNWASILGPLVKIKPGDIIEIMLSDNEKKKFRVEYTSLVTSGQTEILAESRDARITIYTCAGFLDTKRFVATAILIKS